MKIPKKIKEILTSFKIGKLTWMTLRSLYVKYICLTPAKRLQKYGKKAIHEVHTLLTSAGLPYFADYGTLLGIVRDKGFIKHDDDIDLSIPPNSPSPKTYMEVLRKSKNLVFCWAFEYKGQITELTFTYKGISVDLFFSRIEDEAIYNYAYKYTPGLVDWLPYREKRMIDGKFVTKTILGQEVIVPNNYEDILESKYGNWKCPVDYHGTGQGYDQAGGVPVEYMDGVARKVDAKRVREIG